MIYDSKDIFKKCTLNILYISCANTHNDVATFKLDIILQIQKKKKRISQKCNWIFSWNNKFFNCVGKTIFSEVTIFTGSNLLFLKGKMHVYLYEKDFVVDLKPLFYGRSSIQNRASYRRNCKRNPALNKYSFLMLFVIFAFSHIF